jgi:recombinational DNA repair protein (RecF pathway)
MFRLILLTAREIARTKDCMLALSYFAFWTVRLGGWLPRFDRCTSCDVVFGAKPAFWSATQPGLLCEKCRHPGMKPLHLEGRDLAERFTNERLDRIEFAPALHTPAKELRAAALSWIEHHSERHLITRELLETA